MYCAGIPEYNCKVNPGKTRTNFELLDDGTVRVLNEGIELCMCSNVCGQLIVVWYLLHTTWNKKSHDDHVRVVTVQYYTQATILWCKPRYEFSHLIFMCSHMWQSPLVQWIGWCGLMVNTRTVDIHYDYSRYTKKSKSWSFTKGLHSANGFLFYHRYPRQYDNCPPLQTIPQPLTNHKRVSYY